MDATTKWKKFSMKKVFDRIDQVHSHLLEAEEEILTDVDGMRKKYGNSAEFDEAWSKSHEKLEEAERRLHEAFCIMHEVGKTW
jgi:hypothetical protein